MKSCFLHAWLFLGGPNFVVASSSVERITKGAISAKIRILVLLFCFVVFSARAATWYVDNTATGSNNGTSWANAWTSLSSAGNGGSVQAGDTVYISGGASGKSQTYNFGLSTWTPASGTPSSYVTYQIGQDSNHNGMAWFETTSTHWIPSSAEYYNFTGQCTNDGRWNSNSITCYTNNTLCHFNLNNTIALMQGSGAWIGQHFAYFVRTNDYTWADNIFEGMTACQYDHFIDYMTDPAPGDDNGNIFSGGTTTGGGLGNNSIHDAICYLPHVPTSSGSGLNCGCDLINGSGDGFSLYNCRCYGYNDPNFVGYCPNHQDFFQWLSGTNVEVYNNYIQDMGNYAIYVDMFAGFLHLYIYNNIIAIEDPNYNTGNLQAIAIGGDISGGDQPDPIGDCVVNNNIIADYGINAGITVHYDDCCLTQAGQITVANNININSTSPNQIVVGTNINNVSLTLTSGSSNFISYTSLQSSNANFNLVSPDTTLIKAGTNLTVNAPNNMIDVNGVTRPVSGAWDVGPYEYVSGSPIPAISISPSSLNFGVVQLGSISNLNLTVQNTGSGTLAGAASVGSPFSILSGGSYSLGASQSQTVTVGFSPTVASNYTQIVSTQAVNFSGGSGTNAIVSGAAVVLLPPTNITIIGSP
jgi:hypothetical protein